MVSFRVRASSLSEVGALLGTVVTAFDTHLSTVDSRVNASVGSAWEGEDAEKFAEGWAAFLGTAAAVRQSLVALQGGLFAADGSYTQSESGIQRSFAGRTNSVAAIKASTGGVGSKVTVGEERADAIAEHFGRGEGETGGAAAFVGGIASRPSSGQQSSGPADDDDAGDAAEGAEGTVVADVAFEAMPADASIDLGGTEAGNA